MPPLVSICVVLFWLINAFTSAVLKVIVGPFANQNPFWWPNLLLLYIFNGMANNLPIKMADQFLTIISTTASSWVQ